jgi:hypothetical protein
MLAIPDEGTLMRTDRIRCDFVLIEPAHQTLQFHTDDFGKTWIRPCNRLGQMGAMRFLPTYGRR